MVNATEQLLNNPAFQAAFAADPELNRLEQERRAIPDDARQELATMLGAGLVLSAGTLTVPIPPPPPGVIALLFLADSPFLRSGRTIRQLDILTAWYIVIHGRAAAFSVPDDLELRVMAYWHDAGTVDYRDLARDLSALLRSAFRPYSLLPKSDDDDVPAPVYDAAWLSGLVARVAGVTNLMPDAIVWDMPMSAAAQYDLQYRRFILKSTNIPVRRGNEDAAAAYWQRMEQLVAEWQGGNHA